MALSPKFTVDFNCGYDGFSMIQTTGTYDASTNTGGYNSPNITTSDVDSTELVIVDLFNDITFDTITTITAASTYTITTFDLTDLTVDGVQYYADSIADGIFSFTFKVIDGSNTYQYNVRKLIIPDLTCTLTDAMMDIVNDSCGCGSKELIEDWLEGFAYVEALKGAAICGDISQFSTLYENAQNYLNDLNCNC